MRNDYTKDIQQLTELTNTTGNVELLELDVGAYILFDKISVDEIVLILEENDFEYTVEDGGILVEDTFDELMEEFDDYDFAVTVTDVVAQDLVEASAVRKVVVRKGKRKIIFKCAPGQHKVGKRRCVKTSGRDLMKLKRRAKRSARKSKSKRSQANRRRKISNRKRPHNTKHKK